MMNERRFVLALQAGIWSVLIIGLAATICGALINQKIYYDTIFVLKHVLASGPCVLDLLMILFSFYLMLDGVYRWGLRKEGAFSRCLIGLFILHTSSVQIPYVPYLALFLELALCIRNAQIGRSELLSSKKNQSLEAFLET